MWWGGYNIGRTAGAAITNMYASDAPVCPSGEPRQPKYDHLRRLLWLVRDLAPVLLKAPTALNRSEAMLVEDMNGNWILENTVRGFSYDALGTSVLFVENDSKLTQKVKVPGTGIDTLEAHSTSVFANGRKRFNSAQILDSAQSYRRWTRYDPVTLENATSWNESFPLFPYGRNHSHNYPVEQTQLNTMFNVSSDYARYMTIIQVNEDYEAASLTIGTSASNTFTVYLDGKFMGEVENHSRNQGDVQLRLELGPISQGSHSLVLLSESLGYSNIIGRWNGNTKKKTKGVTGTVGILLSGAESHYQDLTDGSQLWVSAPGLSIDHMRKPQMPSSCAAIGQWTKFEFQTPSNMTNGQKLFVELRQGRGHLWLNGFDLGRYWNITTGESSVSGSNGRYTQSHYFLPHGYLKRVGSSSNELFLFNSIPQSDIITPARLVMSGMEPTSNNSVRLPDEVGAAEACLE